MIISRFCYRCNECLSVFFTEQEATFGRAIPAIECGCGGVAELMGRVERDRILQESYDVPCDGRCTNALGPKCDCSCGGINHGSGMLVEVVSDITSKIPKAQNKPCKERAEAYRQAIKNAVERMATKYGEDLLRYNNGQRLEYPLYWQIRKDLKLFEQAKQSKTQKNRLNKLEMVANDHPVLITSAKKDNDEDKIIVV